MKKRIFLLLLIIAQMIFLTNIYSNIQQKNNMGIIQIQTTEEDIDWQTIQVDKVSNLNITEEVTVCAMAQKAIGLTEMTNVMYVEQEWERWEDIKLIRGDFLSTQDIIDNKKVIVIQDKIALENFATYNCIGKAISIDKEEYTVIGVFKRKNSVVNSLTYVQPTAYISIREYQGNTIYELAKINKEMYQVFNTSIEEINKDYNYTVYYVKDYGISALNIIKANIHIFWLFILVSVVSWTNRQRLKLVSQYENTKFYCYLKEFLSNNKMGILKILVGIGIIVILLGMYQYMYFIIESKYVPTTLASWEKVHRSIVHYIKDLNELESINIFIYHYIRWAIRIGILFLIGNGILMGRMLYVLWTKRVKSRD